LNQIRGGNANPVIVSVAKDMALSNGGHEKIVKAPNFSKLDEI
jgi:hypothetical protein